jgi:hypothetical protein
VARPLATMWNGEYTRSADSASIVVGPGVASSRMRSSPSNVIFTASLPFLAFRVLAMPAAPAAVPASSLPRRGAVAQPRGSPMPDVGDQPGGSLAGNDSAEASVTTSSALPDSERSASSAVLMSSAW